MITYSQQLQQYSRYCRHPQMQKYGSNDFEADAVVHDPEGDMYTNDPIDYDTTTSWDTTSDILLQHADPGTQQMINTMVGSGGQAGTPTPEAILYAAVCSRDNGLIKWLYNRQVAANNGDVAAKKFFEHDTMINVSKALQSWISNDYLGVGGWLNGLFGGGGTLSLTGSARTFGQKMQWLDEDGNPVTTGTDAETTAGTEAEATEETATGEGAQYNLANNYVLPTALLAAPVALGGVLSGRSGAGLIGAGLVGMAGLGYGMARQHGWEGWEPVEDLVAKMQNWEMMQKWNKNLGIQTYYPTQTSTNQTTDTSTADKNPGTTESGAAGTDTTANYMPRTPRPAQTTYPQQYAGRQMSTPRRTMPPTRFPATSFGGPNSQFAQSKPQSPKAHTQFPQPSGIPQPPRWRPEYTV